MTDLKKQHERAVGDAFVRWYNSNKSASFVFQSLGADPPDLVYQDGERMLPLEITTAYYDSTDARMRWGHARNDPRAPNEWSGVNPDQLLMADVGEILKKKCLGTHENGTVLVVQVYPAITTISDVDHRVKSIPIPTIVPFSEIYLTGDFPTSSTSPGGYYCWKLRGA